jgi:hypothetical protein
VRQRFNRAHDGSEIALTNFALTFAKALLVFCVVLFVLISPPSHDGVKPNAEFLITVDWMGTTGAYDIDSWMRLPDGNRINFQNKESGIAFLERDDLGNDCKATTNGGMSINVCEEIVVLRGVMPGEYVFALHLFSALGSTSSGPTKPIIVHVKIEKLNPTVAILWQTAATLDTTRQEKPVVRFTMTPDGDLATFDTEELPSIVYGFH